MQAKGYVAAATSAMREPPTAAQPGTSDPAAAFESAVRFDPATIPNVPPDTRTAAIALGRAPRAPMLEALRDARLPTSSAEDASQWLVTTDDDLHPELARINREALAAARPWLLVRAGARECRLGPLFVPEETGCWACLARRIERNDPARRFVALRTAPRQRGDPGAACAGDAARARVVHRAAAAPLPAQLAA